MKFAWIGCLLFGSLLTAGIPPSETNVNSRYVVESVEISGDPQTRVSGGLRKEMTRLIGEKLNPSALDDLARRMRKELHVRAVTHRVLRGSEPEHVKVVFDVKGEPTRFDVSVPKFLYHSRQGWSAAVEGTATIYDNSITLGVMSDGDELAERYAGVLARYEKKKVGSDRVRFGVLVESFHEQWNGATRAADSQFAEPTGIYRTRQNVEPAVTFVLARPLTLTVGAGFQRLESQSPLARTLAANAVISNLRFHQRLEGIENQQDLDAGYSLRAATRWLDSDFAYTRHRWNFRYVLTRGRQVLMDEVSGGLITGRAPLFERFVLGTSTTLRGWNKFDLAPLGGDHMAHNSVEYRYRVLEVFYDTGAVWSRGQQPVARHSAGVGLRQGAFSLAVAFPLREGRFEPLFMIGMNY